MSGFWDKIAREAREQRQAQTQPISAVAPRRWWQSSDIPPPAPEKGAEDVFLDLHDPMQARRPVVGSEIHTASVNPRSWESNGRPVQQGNQFGQNARERAHVQRALAAGRYNTDGVDVMAARQNAAAVRELNQQHLFDSSENQRMPQRF
jgi:hypothetical protein